MACSPSASVAQGIGAGQAPSNQHNNPPSNPPSQSLLASRPSIRHPCPKRRKGLRASPRMLRRKRHRPSQNAVVAIVADVVGARVDRVTAHPAARPQANKAHA